MKAPNVSGKIKVPKKLKRRIRECEAEIANISTLPYYTLFNRESERASDLEAAMRKLNSLQCQSQLAGVSLSTDYRTPDFRPQLTIIQFFNY